MWKLLFALVALLAAPLTAATAQGADYYVDQARGDDANSGSEAAPWRTIRNALARAEAGSTVWVGDGVYATLVEDAPRGRRDYLRFRARPGATPVIQGIRVGYKERAPALLSFEGIDVEGAVGHPPVWLVNVQGVEVLDAEIAPADWLGDGRGRPGIKLTDVQDVLIRGARILRNYRGMEITGSGGVRVERNVIRPHGGTGIQYLGGNRDGVIDGNHIQGAPYVGHWKDPEAEGRPHASIISLRSGDVVIRNNILHGMGNTAAIMTYQPDGAGGEEAYSDVLIENNAIFDTRSTYALRFYNVGRNVRLRNNLVFGTVRPGDCNGATGSAKYRYNVAVVVHNMAAGVPNSSFVVENNILIGSLSAYHDITERNNLVWSRRIHKAWTLDGGPGSQVLTAERMGCGIYPRIFEDGEFFYKPINFQSGNLTLEDFRRRSYQRRIGFDASLFDILRDLHR